MENFLNRRGAISFSRKTSLLHGDRELDLMFVDPCIIVRLLQWKPQQDATVYQNFIIPYFKWSSTCFGRHTVHHQEPRTAQAASGFTYVESFRTRKCWTLSGNVRYLTTANSPPRMQKPEVAGGFRLLVMDGVTPETCWASFKIRNIKILIHCCILLVFSMYELES